LNKETIFSKFGFQASRWTKLRQRNHNGHDQSSYQIWKLSDQQYQRSFIHKVKWDGQNSQTEKLHVYVLILYFLLFYAGEFRPTPTFEGSQKIEGCSRVWSWGIRISIFDLLAWKPNLEKNCLFIQTNSFIIFTCPNPVLLVVGFGQVV
jgi:hypothetical protein